MIAQLTNAMTIDVEDYFQVSAFENHIARSSWDSRECRVQQNMERILALFEEKEISATFFTLGWIAERYPALIQMMSEQGHEIASHGYGHQRVTNLTSSAFREDIVKTKIILEDLTGIEVRGYRAPSYSIGRDNLWALEVLAEAGYRYSSSIYPIQHDHYGMPEAPRFAFRDEATGLIEIPISTVSMFQRRFPAGGGGFFRFFPYRLSRWAIQRINRLDRQSCIFYMHPWEIDPKQPRQTGINLKTRFRHYLNLHRTQSRLEHLLDDFKWDRMDKIFLEDDKLASYPLT